MKKENLKLDLIFNIISNVIVTLSPLIITPKLSRVFGLDYLGIKSFTFSIVTYFAIFGVLGLDIYGQKTISSFKDDKEKCNKEFTAIFFSRFIMVFISILFYTLYINTLVIDKFEKIIFWCWIFYLIREMINPIWVLQGFGNYRFLSILNIISQVLYVIFSFVFINEKSDLPLYIIIYTVIPLFISCIYYTVALKNVKFKKILFKDILQTCKKSFIYFIPTISVTIYSMIDKTILGLFDESKITVGLYESSEKLIKVALGIVTASFTIIRTKMTYAKYNLNKVEFQKKCDFFIAFCMFLCWPIMFGIIGITKDFVPIFFGSGFDEVVPLSYVFSLIIPCLTFSGLFQAIYIIPYNLQKNINLYYLIILSMNIILNSILIPLIGTYGAVISTIISEFFLAIILLLKAKKNIILKKLWLSSVKYIISSSVMCGIIFLISNYYVNELIYKLIVEILVGIFIYFVACIFLKDDIIYVNIRLILNKFKRR